MALFNTEEGKTSTPDLTPEEAQEIYGYFQEGLDHSQMFKQKGVPFAHSEAVWAEIKRLEGEANSLAVEGSVSTQDELEKALSSDLLDIPTLVGDIVKYNPTYNEERTFSEWLESFTPEGM